MTNIMRCITVDDEPFALKLLNNYIARIPRLQLAGEFEDALEALAFLSKESVDVVFIDIDMPDLTGFQLLQKLSKRPIVVFTTAYKEFAFDAFEIDAAGYLLKPIRFERFLTVVEKIFDSQPHPKDTVAQKEESIFVRVEYKLVKVVLAEILYIEGLESYIKLHLVARPPVLTLMTMKAVDEMLPSSQFLRIHRSYIISLSKIGSLSHKKVIMQNGDAIPVSNTYRQGLEKAINRS